MLASAPILAGIFAGVFSCQQMEPTNVSMNLRMAPLQVDNTKSHKQLTQLREISSSPHYGGKFPIVNGVTDSRMHLSYSMTFTTSSNTLTKKSCIWIKDVALTMEYTPTVYIANRHQPGSCQYALTYEHEVRHVNVDIATINELSPYIQEVTIGAVEKWTEPEPVSTAALEEEQQKISSNISTVLDKAMDIFKRHLAAKQQQVDTMAEYSRLSKTCLGRP